MATTQVCAMNTAGAHDGIRSENCQTSSLHVNATWGPALLFNLSDNQDLSFKQGVQQATTKDALPESLGQVSPASASAEPTCQVAHHP